MKRLSGQIGHAGDPLFYDRYKLRKGELAKPCDIAANIVLDKAGNVFIAYHDNDGTRVHKFRPRHLAP